MLVLIGPPFGTRLAFAAAALGRTRTMWGRLGGRTSSIAAFGEAVDAAQRTGEFLPHGVEGDFECRALSDQHVIMASAKRVRRGEPDELAQAAANPVALDRIADLFADGETNPRRTDLRPVPCLQDKTTGMSSHTMGSRARPGSLANGPKVTPAFQPLHCSDFGMTRVREDRLQTLCNRNTEPVRHSVFCGPARGARPKPCGRLCSPYERESRGGACVRVCSADTSVSRIVSAAPLAAAKSRRDCRGL
jgi:hypothetical protein